ncbi:MAG: hypothetical protein LBE78_12885 [Burkholderiaceae bacterium]|jgi:hypothetical protein|nr:hypothetical protein [Burkholderiaceae bacterium]
MAHWSDAYIDIPHSALDCSQLVERVLREQFGRDVRFPARPSSDLDQCSRVIITHVDDYAKRIGAPKDGCGVLMIARGRRAHMGLYCLIDHAAYILHSDSIFGASVRTPLARLARCYRIEGYYAWL